MTPENFAQHRRNLAAVEQMSADTQRTIDKLCSLAITAFAADDAGHGARLSMLGERLVEDLRVETEAKRRLAAHWKSAL